ncbi:cholesterol 24-hydroxylase-like isoform X1 [Podarcis raffonei]|uniref:cholesterol 24-hydroxylase-like isoform X1 n=1 Tax=Podarcis raffonei TaxID=65483 RepID=UPI0023295BC5|nr:cholesterol 24-hydroxylase-like isoform X1 [Podarcis raffonei]
MGALAVIWGLLHPLLVALLAVFVFYCCYIKSVHMKYDHIPGPPRASFFFGHLPLVWGMIKKQENYYDLFTQWAEEYGPVLRLNAFHKVALLVSAPEGVKVYLTSPEYSKDPMVYRGLHDMYGVRFLGQGLSAVLDYNHWHNQRRIMDPAFKPTYLMGLMGTFNDVAEELMEVLEKKGTGANGVDVMSLLRRVTLDIIAKVAFGLELKTLHDDQTPFPRAILMVTKGLSTSRIPFFEYLPWNRKVVKEIQESVRLLRNTGKECLDQRQKAMKDGEEIPLDILTQILKMQDQEGNYDEENLLDNFVNFFFAGHETTANLLSFTIMELGRHPEILAKLQEEVDKVIGMNRDIVYEDLGNLKYLSQVLKEVLRLYPPAAATLRLSGKENVIEGIRIPENTSLIFCTYVMGRLGKFFHDPLVFDPDRFNRDQPRHYYCYFPFSLGPRSCIGQKFAMMEAKVVMAKFLQKFEFQLVQPQSFRVRDAGTLRPYDGIDCRLKLRHQYD